MSPPKKGNHDFTVDIPKGASFPQKEVLFTARRVAIVWPYVYGYIIYLLTISVSGNLFTVSYTTVSPNQHDARGNAANSLWVGGPKGLWVGGQQKRTRAGPVPAHYPTVGDPCTISVTSGCTSVYPHWLQHLHQHQQVYPHWLQHLHQHQHLHHHHHIGLGSSATVSDGKGLAEKS